ncbi:MAG TPA: hypothetical protein VF217_10640 [Rhodanobacteraceae bacterium]
MDDKAQGGAAADIAPATGNAMSGAGASPLADIPVMDVVVGDYRIEAPDEVPAGWTTVRLRNEGQQAHFVVFYRLPDGKTIADQQREVVPLFDQAMAALAAGEVDRAGAGAILGGLPAWAAESKYRGGPGLLSPGGTTMATINLDEPGTYLMECYVKSPDGLFHTSMGMLREIQVTADNNGAAEPEADFDIRLSNAGIDAPAVVAAGPHLVRVNFVEDPQAPLPYDVHLARLAGETDASKLVHWMDWMNIDGLRAPAPVEFLGGVENTPAGRNGYLSIDLEPGRYAWVSEINAQQMLREFVVE